MQESEALARMRREGGVDEAQKAVDDAEATLKAAKERLEQAKADASAVKESETTQTTGSDSSDQQKGLHGVFTDDADPGKFSIDAIQTWAQGVDDPEKIKEVMKKETGEHGKKRAGVQQLLIARTNAIKAAENK